MKSVVGLLLFLGRPAGQAGWNKKNRMHSVGAVRAMLALFVLIAAAGVAQAAHVYAVSSDPWDSGLKVYKVQSNGSLVYTFKTTGPANTQIVATPGGRYIYQFDGRWIIKYDVLDDGTLVQNAPVTYPTPDNYPGYPGIMGIAMHTSGDYLYVSTDWTAIHIFRTDDIDGHLIDLGSFPCGNCGTLIMDRDGEFLFAVGNSDQPNPGPTQMITSYRINQLNGALSATGKHWYGKGLGQAVPRADSRYMYVTTSEGDDTYNFHVLEIQWDGRLVDRFTTKQAPFSVMVSIGRYIVASNTGKGSDVRVYTILGNRFVQTDVKPTEVMYSLTQGSGKFANIVWVTTDDGIVTFRLDYGKLVRIGKVMIEYANPVYYVNK